MIEYGHGCLRLLQAEKSEEKSDGAKANEFFYLGFCDTLPCGGHGFQSKMGLFCWIGVNVEICIAAAAAAV